MNHLLMTYINVLRIAWIHCYNRN